MTSRWSAGNLALEQIAFCDLPDADAVVTGTEKQDLIVRVSVANNGDAPAASTLVLLPGIAHGSQLDGLGYGPYYAPVGRWQQKEVQTNGAPSMKVEAAPGALFVNGKVLLVYRASPPTPAKFEPSLEILDANSQKPFPATNGLCFDLQLQPKETRQIDFVVAGTSKLYPKAEQERLEAVTFDGALRRAEAHWDRAIEGGMKLTTPEPRLQQHVPADDSVHGFQLHQESGHDVDDARALPHVARRDLALGVLRRRRSPWILSAITKTFGPVCSILSSISRASGNSARTFRRTATCRPIGALLWAICAG